jgi:hypothetical protein
MWGKRREEEQSPALLLLLINSFPYPLLLHRWVRQKSSKAHFHYSRENGNPVYPTDYGCMDSCLCGIDGIGILLFTLNVTPQTVNRYSLRFCEGVALIVVAAVNFEGPQKTFSPVDTVRLQFFYAGKVFFQKP